ncbi:MAG: TadE family protein [Chloroflexota bacterium]
MAIGQTLQKVIKILDGQPTGRKGQSLVEMALTTPILILMILGLAEVGFLANNYLILMDAVRAGSRDAATLDPTSWRYGEARSTDRMDCDTDTHFAALSLGTQGTAQYGVRWIGPGINPLISTVLPRGYYTLGSSAPLTSNDLNYRRTSSDIPIVPDKDFGFFDEVACQVLNAMLPLQYNDTDGPPAPPIPSQDDVVVSAISYSLINYAALGGTQTAAYPGGPGRNSGYWATVTGRWPMENRFCAISNLGGTWIAGDERDPFDYKNRKFTDAGGTDGSPAGLTPDTNEGISFNNSSGWNPTFTSYGGYDGDPTHHYVLSVSQARDLADGAGPGDNQGVRGFVFSGHHKNLVGASPDLNPADKCFGSAFRVQDIEERLNLNDTTINPKIPNGGLVIVEIFWQHHPLFFGPLFQGFTGSKANDPVLHVWGWFPVSAAEATPTPLP